MHGVLITQVIRFWLRMVASSVVSRWNSNCHDYIVVPLCHFNKIRSKACLGHDFSNNLAFWETPGRFRQTKLPYDEGRMSQWIMLEALNSLYWLQLSSPLPQWDSIINSLRHKAYSTCRTLFFYLNIETKQHSVVVSHRCTPYQEIIGLSVVPTTQR